MLKLAFYIAFAIMISGCSTLSKTNSRTPAQNPQQFDRDPKLLNKYNTPAFKDGAMKTANGYVVKVAKNDPSQAMMLDHDRYAFSLTLEGAELAAKNQFGSYTEGDWLLLENCQVSFPKNQRKDVPNPKAVYVKTLDLAASEKQMLEINFYHNGHPQASMCLESAYLLK